ncbi:MAG: hypothetical protein AAF553_03765 [Pseudomonadota bacterium]
MSRRNLILAALLLVVACGLFALSQTRRGQNLFYALTYERVYDRYEQTDTTTTDVSARVDANGVRAELLSAFFGLDNGLPEFLSDRVVCEGAGGKDGMPVIFSHEVDVSTLDPGDFEITKRSGAVGSVTCLTLAPANDPDELRTVLLAGEFGDGEDQPASVRIVGNIVSLDGAVTFKEAEVPVTPLEDGPSIVLAQSVPRDAWTLDRSATGIPFGGGSGCPQGTEQIIRVTWAGGVTKPSGEAADGAEARLYEVVIDEENGGQTVITPFALGDLGDGDNNHKLCLDRPETIRSVRFPAGHLTDPRDDLNPDTSVNIAQQNVEPLRNPKGAAMSGRDESN